MRLKFLNTFRVDVHAKSIVIAHDECVLLKLWRQAKDKKKSVLILGGGSNVLFLEDYVGTILLNRIKGIYITESKTEWKLHVGAGEKWNKLVIYTLQQNMPGLENLACIPGFVGAAPIQNIGAYGVELSSFCEYVDVLELSNGRKIRFYAFECNFRYRDSIFRHFFNRYAIVFVGLKLKKKWKPVLDYQELIFFDVFNVTPYQIFNFICTKRSKKLPNFNIHGNAGSFFKNPIIDVKTANNLFKSYPGMPYYYQLDGRVKLSAGWLIERCYLKGYILGEASVYIKQALVLVNNRQRSTGTEIAALALYVRNKVIDKFNIFLQPEVRLINAYGEINSKKIFNS